MPSPLKSATAVRTPPGASPALNGVTVYAKVPSALKTDTSPEVSEVAENCPIAF